MLQLIPHFFINQDTFVILLIVITLLFSVLGVAIYIVLWGPLRPGMACPCGRFYIFVGTVCPCERKWFPPGYIPPKL